MAHGLYFLLELSYKYDSSIRRECSENAVSELLTIFSTSPQSV